MLHAIKKSNARGQSLQILPVEKRKSLRAFIRLPWNIYSNDSAWIPPLLLERHQHLSHKNPFFEHAQHRLWVAYRGGVPVGRISAQVDDLHLNRYQDDTGFFGMIESENELETWQGLLNSAENWLRKQGMRRILGPFNLSINQECGLLVDGFDRPPALMMGHARPYYGPMMEQNGYMKTRDLLAYLLDANFKTPPVMTALTERMTQRIRIRPLRLSHFVEDLKIIRDIFEDAWSKNWGFIPFTQKEFDHMGKDLKLLVDEKLVQIAEVDGESAAMIVVLPNINEILKDLNGRLLPFGWLKLLWRLKVAYPKSARVPLMGVRRRYHDSLIGSALAFMIIDVVRRHGLQRGIQKVELSWILEDNTGMRNIIESMGGAAYKRYRIYQKNLV
jgi:hypothetical protein